MGAPAPAPSSRTIVRRQLMQCLVARTSPRDQAAYCPDPPFRSLTIRLPRRLQNRRRRGLSGRRTGELIPCWKPAHLPERLPHYLVHSALELTVVLRPRIVERDHFNPLYARTIIVDVPSSEPVCHQLNPAPAVLTCNPNPYHVSLPAHNGAAGRAVISWTRQSAPPILLNTR